MNLYLITQNKNQTQGSFYSAIVSCETEEQALQIDPSETYKWNNQTKSWVGGDGFCSPKDYNPYWAEDVSKVQVTYIGKADPSVKPGVVLAAHRGELY